MTIGTVLAIKLGSRECGYALFRNGALARQGVKPLRRSRTAQSRSEVLSHGLDKLIVNEQPDILVLDRLMAAQLNRYPMLAQLLQTAREAADTHGVPVRHLAPRAIRQAIAGDVTATKRVAARAICRRYPWFHKFIGRHRGRQEWYALRMFDAMACGIAFLQLQQPT